MDSGFHFKLVRKCINSYKDLEHKFRPNSLHAISSMFNIRQQSISKKAISQTLKIGVFTVHLYYFTIEHINRTWQKLTAHNALAVPNLAVKLCLDGQQKSDWHFHLKCFSFL